MANIEKIKVGSTSYDVRDASAAHALTDIATAGDNITFTTPLLVNYTIVGSDATVDGSGIASGFTSSSYITSTSNVWNSLIEGGYFELVTKFKMTSMSATNSLVEQESNGGTPFHLYIDQYGRANVDVRRSNSFYLQTQSATGLFSDNTDYWIKVIFSASSFIAIYKSTDGTTWGSAIASNSLSTSLDTNGNSNYHLALGARYNRAGMQDPANPLQGTIDLTETYFKDANGNILWAPVTVSGNPSINATVPTVDQTYNSSSTNAQSGTAVAEAIASIPSSTVSLTDIAQAGTNIKFVDSVENFIVQGSPTITDRVVSNFGGSNFLQLILPAPSFVTAPSWEIGFKVTTGSSLTDRNNVFEYIKGSTEATRYGLAFFVDNNKKFAYNTTYNGTSFEGTSGTYTVLPNTQYYIRFGWTGTEYYLDYSTDGESFIRDISVQSSTPTYSGLTISDIGIRYQPYYSQTTTWQWTGSIDLNECYIKANGFVVWTPYTDDLLPAITVDTLLTSSAPVNNTTAGNLGQICIDITNKAAYICVESNGSSVFTWKKITP